MGKISRTRRAKSANARNSGKSRLSDKRKLLRDSDSSSTDATADRTSLENKTCLGQGALSTFQNAAAYINPVLEMEEENL